MVDRTAPRGYNSAMRPTLKAAAFAAAGFLPLIGVYTIDWLWYVTLVWNIALAATLIHDSRRAKSLAASLNVDRELPDHFSLLTPTTVKIFVQNKSESTVQCNLRDEPPQSFIDEIAIQFVVTLPPNSRLVAMEYTVNPRTKGDHQFGGLFIQVSGPLGLTLQNRKIVASNTVAVYPTLTQIGKYEMLARRGRLLQVGIRSSRDRGGGSEFESLREYVSGDDYRKIDWSATARQSKLITRQYENEKSQNIVLCVDTGRTMLQRIGEEVKLDQVLDAGLMLANVAAEAGDNVGFMSFDAEVRDFVPPTKGKQQLNRILRSSYKLSARIAETDYAAAFEYVTARWRRRTLMVLFTDLIDRETSVHVVKALPVLLRRHRVLCVLVSDPNVHASSNASALTVDDVYQKAIAQQMLFERHQAIVDLRSRGVWVIDCSPDELVAALVNRYLEIKQRNLI